MSAADATTPQHQRQLLRLENRGAGKPLKVCAGCKKFQPMAEARCVNDGIGHRQLMANAEFSGGKGNLSVKVNLKVNHFPSQGFTDKFIRSHLTSS